MTNKIYEYTVWVDGAEVNDHLLTKDQAEEIAGHWTDAGYEAKVERVSNICLNPLPYYE